MKTQKQFNEEWIKKIERIQFLKMKYTNQGLKKAIEKYQSIEGRNIGDNIKLNTARKEMNEYLGRNGYRIVKVSDDKRRLTKRGKSK